MTFEDLQIFISVCAAGSLSVVARDLGCSQSAVSQHVRRLEQQLGISLLEREPRGVRPTAAGLVLAEAAGDSLATLATARREIDRLAKGETGSLRLVTGGTTLRRFMTHALQCFRAAHPHATLDIRSSGATSKCLAQVRSDQADLAFVTIGPVTAGVEQHLVMEVPWVAVLPKSSVTQPRQSGISPALLPNAGYISLSRDSTSQRQLSSALGDFGVQLPIAGTVEDFDTALLLVELGLGWTIVPETHLANDKSQAGLIGLPVEGIPAVSFGWAARKWGTLSQLAIEFVDMVNQDLLSNVHPRVCHYQHENST